MLLRLCVIVLLLHAVPVRAYELNDGHIHYNRDVWHALSAQDALHLLTGSGIRRAIVSSTPTAGTERLYRLAPGRVIPFLRPYRTYRDRYTWYTDPTVVDYVKQQLATGIYRGFGEFHLFRKHRHSDIVRQLMQAVADRQLAVSAHADAETVEALLDMQPEVTLIWAHCGFDYPVAGVRRLLERYPLLHCELSFRDNMTGEDDRLLPEWKRLLEQYPERFLTGMDTYIPARWADLAGHVQQARHWLDQLHPAAAELIAGGNIERLFPGE